MQILIATHNRHKLNEFRQILTPLGYEVLGADDVRLKECPETGKTFRQNSFQKAKNAQKQTGLITLADDSGLCIHALKNQPGLYSARFAEENGGYPSVFRVIFDVLKNTTDWSAHFHCCLCLLKPNTRPKYFEGNVEGTLTTQVDDSLEKFGYDPIFIPMGFDKTFGGLQNSIKNTISHRARALEKLKQYLDKGDKIR